MIPRPLAAVIFDMDGLLLDTEKLYRTVIFAACASQGLTMTDDVHLSLIGTPKELGDLKLKAHFGGHFDLDSYHSECVRQIDERCAVAIPLRPGAQELLTYLSERGVPTAVATSTRRELAEQHLTIAGVRRLLSAVVTRSDVHNGKPHPETFLAAAAALGANPAHCLALEDSHNGVRAAAAAGMATVMIPDLLPPTPEIEALCAAVLSSLSDVQQHIEAARQADS